MKTSGYTVAVIGATGLVGSEIVTALDERGFPLADLRLYASLNSAGDAVRCGAITARVAPLDDSAQLGDCELIFLAAGEQISAVWVERATVSGSVVIDTSQLFANDVDVPLIVPEVNADDVASYATRGIIASPDAPAIALATVLAPLHATASIQRIVATSFEPVSGAGRAGIEELQRQTVDLMAGRSTEHRVFPQRIAFNAIPQIGEFLAGGAARDEQQTAAAVRRLLDSPDLPISITRVYVPFFYGTAISINIETVEKLTAAAVREILDTAPGVLLQDNIATQVYPTPADIVGGDVTAVGRIREDELLPIIDAWLTIDNVRKGAAVNAVQIAELLVHSYL